MTSKRDWHSMLSHKDSGESKIYQPSEGPKAVKYEAQELSKSLEVCM